MEFIGWCFVFLGVLIQTEVSEMHVKIFDVSMIWFLIVVCTETCETLVVKIGLNRINSPNKDIESEIKFLSIQHERVVDVPLDQELMMEC